VARAALVLELTGSPAWTGYVTFAAMIPSILVSPLAGYLSDRFDRRTVLACAYGINLAHIMILAALVASGAVEPWHVLVLAILNGSARSAQMPSAQALLANLVPREGILNAVSLYQATQQGSRFVGPFLILVVLWITGHEDWVFFLCAALYCGGLILILRIRTRSTGVVEKGAGPRVILRNVMAGLRFMYHHALIFSIVLLVVAHCAMTMSFESLFPVLSRDKLGMEDASIMGGTSYLMVGYGAAALVTSFALAGVQSGRTRGRAYLFLALLSGLTPIGLAFAPNMPLAVLSTAGMGLGQGGFMTLSHAMVQTIAPDAIRGRLMGVYSWHIHGFMATFNLVNGTLAGFTELTAAIILGAGGMGFLIVVGLSMGRLPLRQIYARGGATT
jgi:MFS family permease